MTTQNLLHWESKGGTARCGDRLLSSSFPLRETCLCILFISFQSRSFWCWRLSSCWLITLSVRMQMCTPRRHIKWEAQEDIRGEELNFEKMLFFFGSLFLNQISGNELEVPRRAGWRTLHRARICAACLWSDAIVTELRIVENLYSGCKQADGFKSNGGPFKDASVCILRLRNKCILVIVSWED